MHTLICGTTESGKTTLAHKLAQFDEQEKRPIIVFDPVLTETMVGDWPTKNTAVYTDEEKFVRAITKLREPHSVYIDEGADIFSHAQPENRWILTRGRHYGFEVTLICQRPKLVMPSVRHQCSRCFIFRVARSDLREISEDFGHSGLAKISLDNGDFLCLHSGHAQIARGNIYELLNTSKGNQWNTILNPPLQRSSSSQSFGASTRSGKQSPDNRKPLAQVRPTHKPREE
jgi:hypothetical protein